MKIGIIDIETTDFLERGVHIVEVGITESERNAWIFQHSDLTVEQARIVLELFRRGHYASDFAEVVR